MSGLKRITRRQALGEIGAFGLTALHASAFNTLLGALIEREVRAETGGAAPANLIYLLHHGAPARWCFDGFLNPSGAEDQFLPNASVRNFMNSGFYEPSRIENASYRQTATPISYNHEGETRQIYLPALWDCILPELSGASALMGSLRMRDLLNHLCIIRGVRMPGDLGHDKGPQLLVRPHETKTSLSGRVADLSQRKIPAVGFGTYIGFSAQNSSIFKGDLKVTNPLENLLRPFVLPQTGNNSSQGEAHPEAAQHRANWNSAMIKNKFETVLSALEQSAKMRHPGADKFYSNLKTSRILMDEAASLFGNLQTEFANRSQKYAEIAMKCASPEGAPNLIPRFNQLGGDVFKYVRTLAVAEFLISKELTSTLTSSVGYRFNAGNIQVGGGTQSADLNYAYDEHSLEDRQASALALNCNFRILMASLNEFKRAIGTQFSNTVVVIGAEYSRSAQSDGAGSDHAANANTVSLFSGMFQNFIPIGNIYKQSGTPGGNYQGTWGRGAPTLLQGSEIPTQISNSEIANTIAALTGVTSPVSGQSLLKQVGNSWASRATEAPKNVD